MRWKSSVFIWFWLTIHIKIRLNLQDRDRNPEKSEFLCNYCLYMGPGKKNTVVICFFKLYFMRQKWTFLISLLRISAQSNVKNVFCWCLLKLPVIIMVEANPAYALCIVRMRNNFWTESFLFMGMFSVVQADVVIYNIIMSNKFLIDENIVKNKV